MIIEMGRKYTGKVRKRTVTRKVELVRYDPKKGVVVEYIELIPNAPEQEIRTTVTKDAFVKWAGID